MKRLILTALLLVSACSTPSEPVLTAGSARLVVEGETLTLMRDAVRLVSLAADAFELGLVGAIDDNAAYDPYWLLVDEPMATRDEADWQPAKSLTVTSVTKSRLEASLTFEDGTASLVFESQADGRISARFVPSVSDGAIAFIRLRLTSASNTEGYYGLGQWPDEVNHRGKLRPMQMEADLTMESANNEVHVPVPFLIGTTGWGVFVESRRPGVFDVATQSDALVEITYGTAEESGEGLSFHLFTAAHPLDLTRRYYDVTGDPLLPAEWALGPLIWRNDNKDQAEVLDDARLIRELDLPTSGIWIDRPYATGVNTFDFHADKFPDPPAMIKALHDAGLRVSLWHTPYVAPASHAEASTSLHEEALEKGYFPPRSGTLLNKWGAPIDFTNPDAYAWWQKNIRRYTDLGIEGFKLDFAEDVIASFYGSRSFWQFHDGQTERTMHYGYTKLYHQVYAQTLPASGSFLLARAGRWGDQKNVSVIWPGDLSASLAKFGDSKGDGKGRYVGGLPVAVIQSLTLGASGFPFYGSDTGGYLKSPPNEETFIRWVQHTALSTVMQVGDASSQPPWEYTEANGRSETTLDIYRRYARLHMRLFPYEWTYAKRIAEDGRPIARALGLAHPELGLHPNDVYLFGDNLLVAPVVEPGVTSRDVTLPAGDWYDWWTGEKYSGAVTLDAPLETLPLVMRAGSMVPMLRPTIDTTAPATDEGVESYANDPGALWVRVAPGGSSTFEVFDGTRLDQSSVGGERSVSVEPGSKFVGTVFELVATAKPALVLLNGDVLPELVELGDARGWTWTAEVGGTLWVKVVGAGAVTLTP